MNGIFTTVGGLEKNRKINKRWDVYLAPESNGGVYMEYFKGAM